MMSYTAAIAKVRADHHAQIEADLHSAREDRVDARNALDLAERQVYFLESLLGMEDEPPSASATTEPQTPHSPPDGRMTLHAAMYSVLKDSPEGKLRAGDIIAEIARRDLYRMRDGRLPESQQIHARANHYPDMFGKDGSFFYPK
jgi:outer membrane protein TolC